MRSGSFLNFFKSLFLAILLTGLPTYAEVTDDSPTPTEIGNAPANNCQDYEVLFQTHLLGRLEQLRQHNSRALQCLSQQLPTGGAINSYCAEFTQNQTEHMTRYEDLMRRHRIHLFRTWLENQPQGIQETLQSCFGSPEQAQVQTHSRLLQIQESVQETQRPFCNSIAQPFYADVLQEEYSEQTLRSSSVLSEDDRQFIENYRNSPEGRVISDYGASRNDLTTAQRNEELSRMHSRLRSDAETLQRHISQLSPTNLYRVYAFQNEFEDYASSLPEPHQTQANHCYQTSIVFRECGNISWSQCLVRSFQRPLSFALDIIPLISASEVFRTNRIGRNQAAFNLGLITLNQFNATQFEIASQLASSLPFLGASARASGAASQAMIRAGQRSFDTLTHPPVLSRRALDHILQRHPPTPYSQLETSVAAQLRGLVNNPRAVAAVNTELTQIRGFNRIINDPNASTEAIAQATHARGEAYSRVTNLMSEYLPNLDRRRPSSLFPANFNLEAALVNPNTRSQLVRVTPDGRQSLHRLEADGIEFEVWICNRPPCTLQGGGTARRPSEVLTAYPCGDNARGYRSLRRVVTSMAERGLSAIALTANDLLIQRTNCTQPP